jgi:glucose-1-phosphate cytidylyltransferase
MGKILARLESKAEGEEMKETPLTLSEIPVFILCGGLGTRIKEETELRPKPMVPVGNHPILWHIMKYYSAFGFRKFVLCAGFKSEVIKSYFLHYSSLNSDFTIDLKDNCLEVHSIDHEEDWQVTVAYTGEANMTGSRVAQAVDKYLGDAEHFAVTYGDGLCDVDLGREFAFHVQHGKTGTILGVNPPSRFGELKLDGEQVVLFEEKPDFVEKWINGGYFFFRRAFTRYLAKEEDCVLEKEPLVNLARDGEMMMYKHKAFWQCMDTQRDRDLLEGLWESGQAPWKKW